MSLLALLAALPCLYWTSPVETAADLKGAGITHVCVPVARAEAWLSAGFAVVPLDEAELAARRKATAPGILARADRVSATRSPWIDANGWLFRRAPAGRYEYELPVGKAALAAAEAFAYGVDAALAVDPGDLAELGRMQAFLAGLPVSDLPDVADLGVVDDGGAVMGEVLNLLTRRNLLYRLVSAPSAALPLTIQVGPNGYSLEEAADPSAFALAIRRKLTDAKRSLRLFGSEAVIARLTSDAGRLRLHLLNYGGREIEGLRIRLRGTYPAAEAQVAGHGRVALTDHVVADGATELSLPRLPVYGVVDLTAGN
ncbi:MAG TPA: hypothetical protein VMT87_03905 [Vicinamibacteria bacterium]|nr:hypothetical protein [Vicinamibacteria bacterium]